MKIGNYTIQQLYERLENTVPTKQYVNAIKALKRCQELLSEAAVHVTREGLQHDIRVYAGSLDLFFDDLTRHPQAYVDITNGYDPVEHLRNLGVIPKEGTRKTFVREDMVKVREKLKKTRPAKKKGGRK